MKKYINIHILGTAIYHPKNRVDNEYYKEHFKKMGIEITGLLKHLDRKERYIIKDDSENVISMAVKSSQKVMKKANMPSEKIDMIVFVSDNPEYTTPCNALLLHHHLKLKNACIAFDFNNNCIGMITAIDIVSKYMKGNKSIKNALIVGAQMVSIFAREDDPITYATSGDGSAAIILQSREEEEEKGFMDSQFKVDSSLFDKMRFPACGMDKILCEEISSNDKRMVFIPHDVSYFSDEWKTLIEKLINKNNLEISDIKHYFFSQFSHADIFSTLDKLNVSKSKHTFIADKYGYTGCTSPIFALNEALEKGKLDCGDKVIFCSVGIGYSMAALLYKF